MIAVQAVAQATPEIHKIPPVTGFVTVWGVTINPMAIVLTALLCIAAGILWQAQRSHGRNTFDIWDLVMDTLPDGTRRASGIKSAFQTAFVLSSWVIVDQEIKGALGEAVFGLYLATWCASLIAKVVFDKQDPPQIGDLHGRHSDGRTDDPH